ncbi:MAG: hydrogenase maturation nickel metallochaperone HypA [Candidatus Methylomirabilales bacterium]
MHEVSLMQDTLVLAVQHAKQAGAKQIHRLSMRIGDLSGVVPDALEFAFDVVARGTMAEGARLAIERVPLRCYCEGCGREFEPADYCCECPGCRRPSADIRAGREMELTSLEVS